MAVYEVFILVAIVAIALSLLFVIIYCATYADWIDRVIMPLLLIGVICGVFGVTIGVIANECERSERVVCCCGCNTVE